MRRLEGLEERGLMRRTVSSRRVLEETSLRRCLGFVLRLRGQKRSPLPPAMMKRRKGEATGRVYVKVRVEVSLKFSPISKAHISEA
jgi:hypothetical protein